MIQCFPNICWNSICRMHANNLNLDRCLLLLSPTRVGDMLDDEKLIIEVQKHECLFNPRNKHYKNNLRRDNKWNKVGESVGATGKQFYCLIKKGLKVLSSFRLVLINQMFITFRNRRRP